MPDTTASVTASKLNVRERPDTRATIKGTLSRGATVSVHARSGSWYEVSTGALRGFAHGDFLHLHTEAAADGFLCHDDALCTCALDAGGKRIDASALGGTRRQAAETWNRYGGLLAPLSRSVEIAPGAAVGVLCVESGGRGFVGGRLVIRFENHVFWDQWGKRNEAAYRERFTFDAGKRWTRHRFRRSAADEWSVGHTGQDAEWKAFEIARALSEPAALRSISMGAPQIMGFNAAAVGYDAPREMFDRFSADERFHVLALFDFIKGPGRTSHMLESLRRRDYERFATRYNGPGQASQYGAKIRGAVDAFSAVAPGVV